MTCQGWRVRFFLYSNTYLEILEVSRQRKRLGPLLAQAAAEGRHLPPFPFFLFLFLVGLGEVREGEAAAEHVRVITAASPVLFIGEAEAEKEAAVAVGGGRRQLLKQSHAGMQLESCSRLSVGMILR